MTRSRKLHCAGAVVCFLILGASSCATNQPPSHNGKPIIEFSGDSITVQSTDDINAHFGGTWDIGINATVGITTQGEALAIAKQALDAPAVEVINLGTNDAHNAANGSGETVAQATANLDTFNAEFPSSCVVFVTIDTHDPSWGPIFAEAINDHIRATFPHVADWDAVLAPADFVKPDNPHPNETGRQALLAVEDQAIAGCTPAT